MVVTTRTIEFGVLAMEGKLGHEVVDVLGNEWRVSSHAFSSRGAPRQALKPAGVGLRLLENDGMALLEHFVDGNERLERLHLVGENWLPGLGVSVARGPGRASAHSDNDPELTYTFMPCQKEAELL